MILGEDNPLLETDEATRDFAYNEWELLPTRAGVKLSLRTVRTRTHKLIVDLISGAGELYDLENDPKEMKKLFDDPEGQRGSGAAHHLYTLAAR